MSLCNTASSAAQAVEDVVDGEACRHCGGEFGDLLALLVHDCHALRPAKKRNASPEKALKDAIRSYCKLRGCVPVKIGVSAGKRMIGGQERFVSIGQRGTPDLAILLNDGTGRTLWCEVKSPTGRLTPEQATFRTWCQDRGIPHVVARSVDDVKEWVR